MTPCGGSPVRRASTRTGSKDVNESLKRVHAEIVEIAMSNAVCDNWIPLRAINGDALNVLGAVEMESDRRSWSGGVVDPFSLNLASKGMSTSARGLPIPVAKS